MRLTTLDAPPKVNGRNHCRLACLRLPLRPFCACPFSPFHVPAPTHEACMSHMFVTRPL